MEYVTKLFCNKLIFQVTKLKFALAIIKPSIILDFMNYFFIY